MNAIHEGNPRDEAEAFRDLREIGLFVEVSDVWRKYRP
jgi:hypothetical protein